MNQNIYIYHLHKSYCNRSPSFDDLWHLLTDNTSTVVMSLPRRSMRTPLTSTPWQTTCTETWWLMARTSASSSGKGHVVCPGWDPITFRMEGVCWCHCGQPGRDAGAGFTRLHSADCLFSSLFNASSWEKAKRYYFSLKLTNSGCYCWDLEMSRCCGSLFERFSVCLSCSPTERTVWCHDWGLILWCSHLSATVTVVLTSWRMRPASALSPAVVWPASSYSLRFPQKRNQSGFYDEPNQQTKAGKWFSW